MATDRPPSAHRPATVSPAGPAPKTTTSYESGISGPPGRQTSVRWTGSRGGLVSLVRVRLGCGVQPGVRHHCLQRAQRRAGVVAPVAQVGELPPPQRLVRPAGAVVPHAVDKVLSDICLLYTSDAADDLLCVDLGGRR